MFAFLQKQSRGGGCPNCQEPSSCCSPVVPVQMSRLPLESVVPPQPRQDPVSCFPQFPANSPLPLPKEGCSWELAHSIPQRSSGSIYLLVVNYSVALMLVREGSYHFESRGLALEGFDGNMLRLCLVGCLDLASPLQAAQRAVAASCHSRRT